MGGMDMGRKQILLLCSMIMLLCSGCSLVVNVKKDPLPEETIEVFEDAVNQNDIQGYVIIHYYPCNHDIHDGCR